MSPRAPKLSAPSLDMGVVSTTLQENMQDLAVFGAHWLHAGAGAGKTQGTRLWLTRTARPFAWIQLDPLDNDPVLFSEHLRIALLPLLEAGATLPIFHPAGGVSLLRHREFFWNAFFAGLKRPAVLVLDDAHQIHHWEQHPILRPLLSELDHRLHVVVLSRQNLPPCYARQVVNRHLHYVGPQAFVWQAKHVRDWLKKRWELKRVSQSFVDSLLHCSQGWAAVLGLLDIRRLAGDPNPAQLLAHNPLELGALIEASLLEQLSLDARTILRWLATLGSFPERWIELLNLPKEVRSSIRAWCINASVIVRLEGAGAELRFHPLFSEILQQSKLPNAPRLDPLRDQLVDACVREKRFLDAISLCRLTEHWERYWSILEQAGSMWLEHGQFGLLSRALSDLPNGFLERFDGPSLSIFLAAARLRQEPVVSYHQCMIALEQCREGPGRPDLWAMALAVAANAVIASGLTLDHVNPILSELDRRMGTPWFEALAPRHKLQAIGAGIMASVLSTNAALVARLHQHFEDTIERCPNIDLQMMTIASAMRLFVVHGLAQYIDCTYQHLGRLEHRATSPTAKLALLHAKTNHYHAQGEKNQVLQHASAALAYLSPEAGSVWNTELLACVAFSAACTRDLERTRQTTEMIRALLPPETTERSTHLNRSYDESICELVTNRYESISMHLRVYEGCLDSHEGRFESAARHFEAARASSDAFGYPVMQVVTRTGSVVAAIELGARNVAEEHIARCDAIVAQCEIPLANRSVASLKALFAVRFLPIERAIPSVQALLQSMQDSNSYLTALDMFPHMEEILAFALEHDIKVAQVHEFIRRSPLFPSPRPHPRWPSLFEVRVLGRFELRIRGKQQRDRFMTSGRRFELLTALLWEGAEGISYQDCFDRVWPYIESDRQARVMKSALKRLLVDLDHPRAILDKEDRLQLNPDLWQVDAWELQAQLEAGESNRNDALLARVLSGFYGPTNLPSPMRGLVPSQGDVDLGPKTLLPYLR